MNASKRRLRVLLVVDAFPSVAAPADGIFLRDQAKALAAHTDVAVAIGRTVSPRQLLARRRWCSPDATAEIDGVVAYTNESFVPTTRSTRQLIRARCRSIERAVRAFERRFGRPDVLHAHCAAFAGETAVHVGRAMGVPVVITEHYSFLPRLFETYGDRLRHLYEAAEAVCAVSQSQARRLAELGVKRAVRCLPNTVDTDAFTFDPILPPADGVWKLLCVARDHEVKDIPALIRAMAQLRGVRCELSIAGSGDYRSTRSLSEGLGLGDRIRFIGTLARPELVCVMRASHLIVSSSRIETFGLSLAESLCVGRPVVTTDSGGPRDIVLPQDGRIVPVGDAPAMAKAIADVLDRYGEFDQAAMSASARERFGPAAFAAKAFAVYEDVLAMRRDGVRNGRPTASERYESESVLCGSGM